MNAADMRNAIAYVETHLRMPKGTAPLKAYARYYSQHKGILYAVYALPYKNAYGSAGIHSVPYDQLPLVMDGGCNFVDVTFVPRLKGIGAECHGEA